MQQRTVADYTAMLQGLLPPGDAWTREPDTVLTRLLAAAAEELVRVDDEAMQLMGEALPDRTLQLLPDWERAYGLPDACSTSGETIDARRAALLLRVAGRGGQSPSYFTALAGTFTGAACTVEEFRPFRVGMNHVGERLYGTGWLHVWRLRLPASVERHFTAGRSTVGEPLNSWGDRRIECLINLLKPAHTVVVFAYGDEA